MCGCDDDGPEAFCEVTRKARIEHRCCECRGVIAPGQTYEYASGIWDGDPRAFKTCSLCVEARKQHADQLTRYDCQPCFGELYEGWASNELPPHVAAIRNAA
ncbi:MAG TPA: hypothetical protein VF443_10285 [Nitrospira sp.]